jgi:hypothetical protein
MEEKKKTTCPLLNKDCLEKACEWFCVFDRGGARESPQGCAVRFFAQSSRMIATKPK